MGNTYECTYLLAIGNAWGGLTWCFHGDLTTWFTAQVASHVECCFLHSLIIICYQLTNETSPWDVALIIAHARNFIISLLIILRLVILACGCYMWPLLAILWDHGPGHCSWCSLPSSHLPMTSWNWDVFLNAGPLLVGSPHNGSVMCSLDVLFYFVSLFLLLITGFWLFMM